MTYDPNKEYETRSGCEFRFYAHHEGQHGPIHGAWKDDDGVWRVSNWNADLSWLRGNHCLDLIEKPKTIKGEVWVNVYADGDWRPHKSKESADRNAAHPRMARIRLPFECKEGQFDE